MSVSAKLEGDKHSTSIDHDLKILGDKYPGKIIHHQKELIIVIFKKFSKIFQEYFI